MVATMDALEGDGGWEQLSGSYREANTITKLGCKGGGGYIVTIQMEEGGERKSLIGEANGGDEADPTDAQI